MSSKLFFVCALISSLSLFSFGQTKAEKLATTVIQSECWTIPGFRTAEIRPATSEIIGGVEISVATFHSQPTDAEFELFYSDQNSVRVVAWTGSVSGGSVYSHKGRMFRVQVGYRLYNDRDGKRVYLGIVTSVDYYDQNADGCFETARFSDTPEGLIPRLFSARTASKSVADLGLLPVHVTRVVRKRGWKVPELSGLVERSADEIRIGGKALQITSYVPRVRRGEKVASYSIEPDLTLHISMAEYSVNSIRVIRDAGRIVKYEIDYVFGGGALQVMSVGYADEDGDGVFEVRNAGILKNTERAKQE